MVLHIQINYAVDVARLCACLLASESSFWCLFRGFSRTHVATNRVTTMVATSVVDVKMDAPMGVKAVALSLIHI